jgi:hypothetical protein
MPLPERQGCRLISSLSYQPPKDGGKPSTSAPENAHLEELEPPIAKAGDGSDEEEPGFFDALETAFIKEPVVGADEPALPIVNAEEGGDGEKLWFLNASKSNFVKQPVVDAEDRTMKVIELESTDITGSAIKAAETRKQMEERIDSTETQVASDSSSDEDEQPKAERAILEADLGGGCVSGGTHSTALCTHCHHYHQYRSSSL